MKPEADTTLKLGAATWKELERQRKENNSRQTPEEFVALLLAGRQAAQVAQRRAWLRDSVEKLERKRGDEHGD